MHVVGVGLEQAGPLGGRRRGGEAQRAGVLRGGLAVRAERGGAGRGRGRVGQDGGRVAGRRRRGGRGGPGRARPRAARPARAAPARGARGGAAAAIVSRIAWRASSWRKASSSPWARQHPDRDALLGAAGRVVHQRGQQPGLDLGADDRGRVERGPAVGRQARGAGQHRVAHGGRDAGVAAGQHLGDEERVAAGLAVQRGAVERLAARRACAPPRPTAAPAGCAAPRWRWPGRRARCAAGGADRARRRGRSAPAARAPAGCGGRGTGPGRAWPRPPSARPRARRRRAGGDAAPRGPRRRCARGGAPASSARAAPGRPAERCRRRARAAAACAGNRRRPRARGPSRRAPREVLHQRGLADAGLAVHQRDAPLAGRGLAQRGGERLQRGLTLEQGQGTGVGHHGAVRARSRTGSAACRSAREPALEIAHLIAHVVVRRCCARRPGQSRSPPPGSCGRFDPP